MHDLLITTDKDVVYIIELLVSKAAFSTVDHKALLTYPQILVGANIAAPGQHGSSLSD